MYDLYMSLDIDFGDMASQYQGDANVEAQLGGTSGSWNLWGICHVSLSTLPVF